MNLTIKEKYVLIIYIESILEGLDSDIEDYYTLTLILEKLKSDK
jgi:hypothetical protein